MMNNLNFLAFPFSSIFIFQFRFSASTYRYIYIYVEDFYRYFILMNYQGKLVGLQKKLLYFDLENMDPFFRFYPPTFILLNKWIDTFSLIKRKMTNKFRSIWIMFLNPWFYRNLTLFSICVNDPSNRSELELNCSVWSPNNALLFLGRARGSQWDIESQATVYRLKVGLRIQGIWETR